MKTIQEQIEVMQHFANGGEVEALDGTDWRPVSNPNWNWAFRDYRIKETVDPYAELKAAAKDPTKQIRFEEQHWRDAGHPWRFNSYIDGYEIRNKPRTVKLLAWLRDDGYMTRCGEDRQTPRQCQRVPSKDKIIEVEA